MSNVTGWEDESGPQGEDAVFTEERQLEDALVQRTKMRRLMEEESFLLLREMVENQITRRVRSEIMPMPMGTDDVVKRTYSAGEIAGMQMVLDMPQMLYDSAQGTIDLINRNRENNG